MIGRHFHALECLNDAKIKSFPQSCITSRENLKSFKHSNKKAPEPLPRLEGSGAAKNLHTLVYIMQIN